MFVYNMSVVKQHKLSCTFFLCPFCRSLNVSIFFTSSFNISESWMWKLPMFSISAAKNNKMNHSTLKGIIAAIFSTLVGFVQGANDWMNLRAFNCSKDALKVLWKQCTFKIRGNWMTMHFFFVGHMVFANLKQTFITQHFSKLMAVAQHNVFLPVPF